VAADDLKGNLVELFGAMLAAEVAAVFVAPASCRQFFSRPHASQK
jgi:hypothetical protein